MNEGIHLDLDTWIVPGQIRKANLCRGLGNRYKPAGTEVLISAVAHIEVLEVLQNGVAKLQVQAYRLLETMLLNY